MVRQACGLAATVAASACLLVACPANTPPVAAPTANDDTALRVRIAQAEAKRGDGVTELVELSTRGTALERALALRGLGRIGGGRARAQLQRSLADDDPAVVTAAASAFGLLGSLDELTPAATTEATTALIAAIDRVPEAARPIVIEALGRVGDASAQRTLGTLMQSSSAPTRRATAFAFGRFGRRKIEWDATARLGLLDALKDPETSYAAAYAFAREQVPTGTQPLSVNAAHQRVAPALGALVESGDVATRAIAAQAIAKQNVVGAAHAQLEKALLDGEWRVAVEAVRALAGDKGDDAGRDAVAAILVRRFGELEKGKLSEAHVVIEALKALAPHARRPLVATAITALARSAASSSSVVDVAYGWIECLALAAMARGGDGADLGLVENCTLPDHLRLPIVAELVGAKVGTLAQRRVSFTKLLAHADVRVRASALGALASLWAEGGAADRDALVSTLVSAISAPNPIFAGSAIDAAPAIYEALGATGNRSALDAAVVARARTEKEPELAAAVLELVGKQKIASGVEACRAALGGHPVLATAAKNCLRALGEPAPERDELPAAAAPPVNVAIAFGARREWVLTTTRGEIVIALDPAAAPWAVAAIMTLTNRHFYDGLEFHRVVPDFVVQGGDPTQSGWGGPGFTLPAEPSPAGFVAGGVGIADSGRDSGGSQWFVMHSPAPHLDARYTYVGRVSVGAKVADALLIGDKVVRAELRELSSTPKP